MERVVFSCRLPADRRRSILVTAGVHTSAHPRCVRSCMREDSTMRLSAIGLLVTLILGVLVAPHAVAAQAPAKAVRIGWLRPTPETPEWRRNLDAFTQELRDHGYVEGQNVTIAVRSRTERTTPLSALLGELLRFQPDVIV